MRPAAPEREPILGCLFVLGFVRSRQLRVAEFCCSCFLRRRHCVSGSSSVSTTACVHMSGMPVLLWRGSLSHCLQVLSVLGYNANHTDGEHSLTFWLSLVCALCPLRTLCSLLVCSCYSLLATLLTARCAGHSYLVSPIMNSDLSQYLESRLMPWGARIKVACDALRGLAHLHQEGFLQ